MAAMVSVRTDDRYVLTDAGREALQTAEVCDCRYVVDLGCWIYSCRCCETVYEARFGRTPAPRRMSPRFRK